MSRLRRVLAVFPAVGVSLCPVCWLSYAGFFSSMGVGFIDYTPYLLPLTVLLLAIAVLSLGYKAKSRRGYLPLIIGVVASVIVLVGHFIIGSNFLMYLGIALLIGASLRNSWTKKVVKNDFCPACIPIKAGHHNKIQITKMRG